MAFFIKLPRLAVISLLLCSEPRKIIILSIGNDFQVRYWRTFDFEINLKIEILTP